MPAFFCAGILLAIRTFCGDAIGAAVNSSEYIVDVWDIQDGLPHSTVTSIVQTRDGYLWCGTHDGVVRFDGVRFVRIGPEDRTNMWANHVFCLHADRRGQLWLGTDGAGLLQYVGGRFAAIGADERSATNSVFSIAEDDAGDLWLGTRQGLGRLSGGQMTWMTKSNGFPNAPNIPRSLAFDGKGRLWMADEINLKVWHEGAFETGFSNPDSKSQRLWAVAHDRSGNLWAGSMDSKIWRGRDGKWNSIGEIGTLPYPDPVIFRETRTGDFWVGTRKGLFRCRAGQWKSFGTKDGMVSPDVRAILEDREGNLWVGTSAGGLTRFKPRLVTTYAARDGLTDERVQALCEKPDGGLWVGLGRGGLFQGSAGGFGRCDLTRDLPSDLPVTSVLKSRDGNLWVGTFGNQLWRFTGGKGAVIDSSPIYRSAADNITALFEDRAGAIWVGTYVGLRTLAGKKLSPVLVSGRYLRAHVTALVEDHAGGMWVGYHGLGLVHLAKGQTNWISSKEGLPTDFVRTLLEDGDGTLWIGTVAGLCRWREGKVSTFTRRNGLVNDTISQILEDDSGNLWLGSNQGIMRVARRDLEAVANGRKTALDVFPCGWGEGMLSLECSGGFCPAGLKTRDGKLWFPTASGLVAVDPSQMKQASNPVPPPVYIEEVVADGQTVMSAPLLRKNDRSVSSPAGMVLPRGVRRLEVRYTALSLTAPERVRFKHRLEGLEPDWTDAASERSAVYTKVPPGHYQFQVMGCNNDGLWNESGAALAFMVPPSVWQTWWFTGMAWAAGISGVAGAARLVEKKRMQRKLESLERERAVERERARIARDIHDDLGASLTRITLLSESARDGHAEGAELSGEIDQIYTTARDLTRSMDEIVWAVNPEHDTLDSVVTYLAKFAQDFLRAAGVRCRLDIPMHLPGLPLTSEVRHGLFLAFKEALHNALKHSAATEVWIRLIPGDRSFTLSIEDNGRGLGAEPGSAAQSSSQASNGRISTGHGLRNMRERLAAMGGRCEVEGRDGEGTKVRFIMAVGDSKRTKTV